MKQGTQEFIREFQNHPRVEILDGSGPHIKVKVDGALVLVLARSHGGRSKADLLPMYRKINKALGS